MSDTNLNVPTGLDRRVYERFIFRQKIKLHLLGDESYELPAIDICAGGLGIVAPFNLASKVTCKVEVSIPINNGALSFTTPVEIKHSIYKKDENGFIIGVSFTRLEPGLQPAIVCLMRGKDNAKDKIHDAIARLGRLNTL